MKARILALDSDEHRVVEALLPWFVNATLERTEASLVEAHLARCARCQADAAAQGRLRGLPVAAAPAGDIERDWAVLRNRLEAKPAAARPPTAPARGWRMRWLPIAVGLQGALVLVLAVALFGSTRQVEPYRTLGAAPVTTTANALVVFRSDATEAEIRHALRASDARLVGGPTVTDAYLLRVPDLGPQALTRLRAQPGVARVESLEGSSPR
ncbi:MAG TPA: zf-HC2 domain-containing protein [Caldimonas sp.]